MQIGDENVHRVRAVMDEVFGDNNFVVQITVVKTSGLAAAARISASTDYILWYARNQASIKYRHLLKGKIIDGDEGLTSVTFGMRRVSLLALRAKRNQLPSPRFVLSI